MSEVDDYFQNSQLMARQANTAALGEDPETAARAVDLSDATGVPASAIYGDVDGFERQHKAALGAGIISDNEHIADYLNSHPMAPRISHDDLGALDDVSRSLAPVGDESRLQKWLKSDSLARTFVSSAKALITPPKEFTEGFGSQPMGQQLFQRPSDIEWASSHPEAAAIAGAASMPVEAMARTTSGLLNLGYENLSKMFGEPFARDMAAMAEWGMMRGDLGVKGGGGGAGGPLTILEKNAELLGQIRSGIEASDIYTPAGHEPPAGIHPLLDDAKKLQTKEDLDVLDEALKSSQQSATRERAADFFSNFIRSHVGEREIGIDAAAIRRIYGDKPPAVDDNLLGWIPDLDKKLAAAEGVGGDVQVPIADWLAKVDPEVAKELHDDIRVRDGGLTVNDTKIGSEIDKPSAQVLSHPDQLRQVPWGENDPTQQPLGPSVPRTEPIKWEVRKEDGMYNVYGDGQIDNAFGHPQDAQNYIDRQSGKTSGQRPGIIGQTTNDNLGAETKQLHPRPEPKSTIAEPLQTTRGAAGLEPLFAVGDRKLELRRRPPSERTYKDEFPADEFRIHDETGKKVGWLEVVPYEGGKKLYIDNIGGFEHLGYGPNAFGPSLTRSLIQQLKEQYPQVEQIGGFRISGAREKAGVAKEAWIKVQPGEALDYRQHEYFKSLLTQNWEELGQGLLGLFHTEGKGLAADSPMGQMVMSELRRLVPEAEADVAHQLKAPGGEVRGVYIPNMRQIIVSLTSPDPIGTARHESIHGLRRMGLLSDKEWATLEKAVYSEDWMGKYDVAERWKNFPKADLVEESVAEAFRDWHSGSATAKDVHPIFEKIKAFFEGIRQSLAELLGHDLSWEEIFKKIDSGEIGSREERERPALAEPAMEVEDAPEGPGLYDRAKALGVTQSHMDRMLRLIDKRNKEDLEGAQRRAEVRQRRRSNAEWKARRTTLRDEVRENLSNRPDLAMDDLFSKQKIKLDPATLSEDQRSRLPKDYVQKKNGVNPDELAPYFGYTSGDALVERLGMLTEDRRRSGMSARDYFNRLVDVETDRRLNAEFGDRQQTILDEAKDQALSETQINLTHEETLAYALKAGVEPQFGKDEVRAMVKKVFDETPVGQISSDRLLQTAGKVGKKIEEAGARGKWDEAYRLSQQRNHAVIAAKLARDYERSRATLDRTAKQFRKREVPNVPAEYTNWVHDILQRVGYPINRSIQDLGENIARQSETTLEDFAAAKEADWMGLRDLPIADFLLDPAFRSKVDDLSHRDFIGLKSSIDVLIKAGRDESKIYREGEAADRATVLSEMRDKLKTFPMKEFPATRGGLSKAVDYPKAFIAGMTNIETLLNRWDRADPNGVFNRYIAYPLAKASNYKNVLQRQYDKALRDLGPIPDRQKLVDAPFVDPLSRTEENPNGSQWSGFTRNNVMAMLQNAGNKSNWTVLARGYGADPEALMQWLHRNTTKEDWDRAQAMGDSVFKSLVSTADRVYERLTGATIEKIPLELIQTPFGEYKGWYHPLIADPIRKEVWEQHPDTGEWERRPTGKKTSVYDDDFFHASTANGYTKKRTGATYPLDLNFDVVPARIRQMIHDIAFRETVLETQKVFDNRAFQAEVTKHYGPIYTDLLMPYLRGIAGAESINSRAQSMAAKVSEYFRQNVISTLIGFNPYTALKHGPTAWVMSMREVGGKDFLSAVTSLYGKSPEIGLKNHEFAMKWSEELQRRERHWQDTIAGENQLLGQDVGARARVVQAGSWLVAQSDMLSAKPTWLAQYEKSISDGLSHGDSVDLADRAVRRAHGSTATTNQPSLVRGGGPLHGWLTSVYGFFGTAMQRRIEIAHDLNDAYQLVKDREINSAAAKVPGIAQNIFTYVIWPTIVEEWVTGLTTDDRRGWGTHLAAGAFMGLSSSVLYLRDMMHAFVTGQDPSAGLIGSPLHDIANTMRDFKKGRQALDRQNAGKTVQHTLTTFGDLTGLAPKTIDNAIRFGIDLVNKQAHPKNLRDVFQGVTRGTEKKRVEK
jgi:hypothetical protein